MSNKNNYNNYKHYNKVPMPKDNIDEVIVDEAPVDEEVIEEAPVEEVVEESPVEEVVEEAPVEETVEAAIPTKIGVVTDCGKLNVRKAPSATAPIVKVITALTEVVIDENEANDEFYKVTTEDAIEGYCMKKFIAVRQ